MGSEDLVAQLRRLGADTGEVEVKAAAGGLPRTTKETISAFANGSGGTLILGLSEDDGFRRADGFNSLSIRDALAGACSDSVDPPIRAPIEIEEFEGGEIVRLDVPELDPVQKPCWVKDYGGPYSGSFIRSGDGDRRLSHYEVSQLLSNREQPIWDSEPVERATLDDLDQGLVQALLDRMRERSPRAFVGLSDERALVRLGAVAGGPPDMRPTLAGLLCLGSYPQQYFPQLFISFVSLPGTSMGDELPDGTRFLDNRSCEGPIPLMISEALEAVRRNMRVAAVMTETGRRDRYNYPLEAIRELVVNAVMHRDYSPESRGTQVQIELYPDRLEIKSPGGIYGSIDISELGISDVSSSRNAVLAKLLSEVAMPQTTEMVCENRGSGMSRVIARLRDAGMTPPTFTSTPSYFRAVVPQQALLDPNTVRWIASLGAVGLSNSEHLALAMMHVNGTVSNEMLRAWGVTSHEATAALTDLVGRGLVTKSGGRRYATYRLSAPAPQLSLFEDASSSAEDPHAVADLDPKVAAVLEAIRSGATTSHAIKERLGLSYQTVIRRIRVARESGLIEETHARHSKSQSYRLVRG